MKHRTIPAFVRPTVIVLLSALLIVAAGLTGCTLSSLNNRDEQAAPPTSATQDVNVNQEVKNETNDPVKPVAVEKSYKVLTGLETTSELADLRPVAISVANDVYSLPQYGIGAGEIVIEVPLEDGTTRLTLLTTDYAKMTTIGAISSTRSYLLEICNAFKAIQCFNGSDATISAEEIALYDTLDYESGKCAGMYYYDTTRFDETDLMTNGILVDAGIRKAELNQTTEGGYLPFVFAAPDTRIVAGSASANRVIVRYSDDLNVSYLYNTATGKYVRYQYGEKQVDATMGTEVAFDNLFILCASSVIYESESTKSLDLVIEDGGSGYYMTNGTYTDITWKRNDDGTLTFYDATGAVLTANRGTSYIGFITAGAKAGVTVS